MEQKGKVKDFIEWLRDCKLSVLNFIVVILLSFMTTIITHFLFLK